MNPKQPIIWSQVVTTYAGQTGCACGCGGTYAAGPAGDEPVKGTAAARRVNKINAHWDGAFDNEVQVYDGANGELIYELEHGKNRVTRVYVKTTLEPVEETAPAAEKITRLDELAADAKLGFENDLESVIRAAKDAASAYMDLAAKAQAWLNGEASFVSDKDHYARKVTTTVANMESSRQTWITLTNAARIAKEA